MADDKKKKRGQEDDFEEFDIVDEVPQRGAHDNYGDQTNYFNGTVIDQKNKRGDNIVVDGNNTVSGRNITAHTSSDDGRTRRTTIVTGDVHAANVNYGGNQTIHGDFTVISQRNERGQNTVVTSSQRSSQNDAPDNGARTLLWEQKRTMDAYMDELAGAGTNVDSIRAGLKILHKVAIDASRDHLNLIKRMTEMTEYAEEVKDAKFNGMLHDYLVIMNTVQYY